MYALFFLLSNTYKVVVALYHVNVIIPLKVFDVL